MIEEIWKDVVGYEDRYQVSNIGRVRSKDIILHKSDGKIEFRKGKIVKLQLSKTGYFKYLFSNGSDKPRKLMLIHRVVAMAFLPNPLNKPNIDHINTIRTDNRLENLRWCTQSENNRNPITMTKYRKKGEYSHSKETRVKIGLAGLGRKASKKTLEKLHLRGHEVAMFEKSGKFIRFFRSPYFAGREIGCCKTHIIACCNQKRKATGGYMWRWKEKWDGNSIEPFCISKPTNRKKPVYPKDWYEKVKKLGRAHSKKVYIYKSDGSFVCECCSTREAANKFGTDSGSVSRVCNGKTKLSKGYKFSYIKL